MVIKHRNPCTKFITFTYVDHERVYSFNVTQRNLYSRKLNSCTNIDWLFPSGDVKVGR